MVVHIYMDNRLSLGPACWWGIYSLRDPAFGTHNLDIPWSHVCLSRTNACSALVVLWCRTNILTVGRLCENVHGYHSDYRPVTVTSSAVGWLASDASSYRIYKPVMICRMLLDSLWFSLTKMVKNEKITNSLTKTKTKKWWKLKRN